MMRALPWVVVVMMACQPSGKPDAGLGLPPAATSIAPTSGTVNGGTEVTINGSNFVDGATVTFGTARAPQVVVQSRLRLTAVTPAVAAGRVSVTVTNPDGQSSSLSDAFTFTSTTTRTITTAVLMNPMLHADASGRTMVPVSVVGQVEVPGVTTGAGVGSGVVAQVGFAEMAMDPPLSADFTWVGASYLGDDGDRDQYAGEVTLPGVTTGSKTYLLAVRFSVDNGGTWTLGDRDGSANGLQRAQLASVQLTAPAIGWCKLGGETIESPPVVALVGSAVGPVIYGQVYKEGVTNTS
ncbi:MAG: IPT/TIG domain-containing protein, partial [Archangium sp.]|nr:IPT/TIG domain-containing protein [Archangium sp.]